MKHVIRFGAAASMVLPAAWMIYFVIHHLWLLYSPPRAYSFGLHLRYGPVRFYDPWSDAIVMVCAVTALLCGVAIARDAKRKVVLAALAIAMLGVVALGVAGAA